MLILVLYAFAFSNCFWLISLNQIDYDELTADEIGSIAYKDLWGAMWWIWWLILGNSDDSTFGLGKGS